MEISTNRIREITEALCNYVNRIAGTKTEKAAADYLKRVLTDIGYDVREYQFPVISWTPGHAKIRLISPEDKLIDCAMLPNSPGVAETVRLVSLDSEAETNEKGLPVYGFAEWGESLYASPGIPYNKALDRGLDGLLICSSHEGELLKVRVGNQGRELQIPVLSISKESGEFLGSLMEDSEVELEIKCEADRAPSESSNLEVVLQGSDSEFEIVVSAHYDAWFSGGADNAAPVAIVIELARQLREYIQRGGNIMRTVRFVLYGAEESGSERYYFWLNGSRSYVENHESLRHVALVMNFDSIGYDATNYVGTTVELLEFAQSMVTTTDHEGRFSLYSPPADGSDHWFFTVAGIPTIYLISWPSPLYHTQKDIPDTLDFKSIGSYAGYALRTLIDFCNAPVLPLDVMNLIEFIRERIEGFRQVEGNPFELQEVSEISTRILAFKDAIAERWHETFALGEKQAVSRLNNFLLETARRLNRTIGKVSRVHEANYLAELELIQDYVMIDSTIQTLQEMSSIKMHPRTLASLRAAEDAPFKLLDIAAVVVELREECKKLAAQINNYIQALRDDLIEIQSDAQALLHEDQYEGNNHDM